MMEIDEFDQALQRALVLGDEGNWDGMAGAVADLLEDDPESAALLCWLGVAERERGHEGVAYERFREAMELEPQDPYILATVGGGLARFDDPDAEGLLRTAALTAPDLPYARMMYGAYLSREGLAEQAIPEFEAAVELAPEDAEIRCEHGIGLTLANRFDEALEALDVALSLDPTDGWARALLGLIFVELDRGEEAATELLRAAESRPEDVELQLLAALAVAATENDERSYEMVERGRMRAEEGDLPVIEAVEERISEGWEAARTMLHEELAPGALRERLSVRP